MLIEIRASKKLKNGRQIYEFLITCDACGVEKWFQGKQCNFGKRKFCSRKCINSGRLHTEKWKTEMSEKFSGKNNPFYGQKHDEHTRTKCIESGSKMLEIKKQQLGAEYEKWYHEYCNKISTSMSGSKNHFYGKHHSDATKSIQSSIKCDQISSGQIVCKNFNRGIKGWYCSSKMNEEFYYDSFWELIRMKILDKDDCIISWTKRHSIKIPYKNNRYYVPDFLINYEDRAVLEEVKGFEEKKRKNEKFDALTQYCKDNKLQAKILEYEELNTMCIENFGQSISTLRKRKNI